VVVVVLDTSAGRRQTLKLTGRDLVRRGSDKIGKAERRQEKYQQTIE